MTAAIVVEMFLDVSCPWCHGALETNRRMLDELAADPAVPPLELQWRFMRLHPMPREGGMSLTEHYASFNDAAVDAPERMRAEVRRYARSVGVRVDETRYDFLHNPFAAHRLLAAVRDDGGDDQPGLWSLARAVFSSNFVSGVDISDIAALRGAVERFGLAVPRRTWELLADEDGHRAETLRDHDRARAVKLDGVPRLVIGERIVATWVDPEVARRDVRAAITEAAAASDITTV